MIVMLNHEKVILIPNFLGSASIETICCDYTRNLATCHFAVKIRMRLPQCQWKSWLTQTKATLWPFHRWKFPPISHRSIDDGIIDTLHRYQSLVFLQRSPYSTDFRCSLVSNLVENCSVAGQRLGWNFLIRFTLAHQ